MNSRTLGSKFIRNVSGSTLVEFAIVLPMLLILSIGSVEIGLYMFEANAAAKATQVGARWAVVRTPISEAFADALHAGLVGAGNARKELPGCRVRAKGG